MPKPTQRLFILAKDLATAIRAVNKGDASLVSGTKISETVKLPRIMKNPIVHDAPEAESLRILQVELPRSSIEFDNPSKILPGGVIENWERLNRQRKASLFTNPDRRLLSSEGVMSADLFSVLAKQGKIKILKEKPLRVKPPSGVSDLPSGFRDFVTNPTIPDNTVFYKARDISYTLNDMKINQKTPETAAILEAWKPFKQFKDFADEAVRLGKQIDSSNNLNTMQKFDKQLSDTIRRVAEQNLPISEPRKRGVNNNLVYRRLFKPKDK